MILLPTSLLIFLAIEQMDMEPDKQQKQGYSYSYTHKTSRGKRLAIRNNIVYLDDKPAPKGYTWYDGNNKVTYTVDSNGTWKPIRDGRGRKLQTRASNSHRGLIQNEEDANFLNGIEEEDKLPIDKLFEGRYNTVKKRLDDEDRYFIPSYLPGVKMVVPRNSSRFNGVEIPYNALDSLKKWTNNKEQFIDVLGLTGETSFQKYRPANSDLSKEEYRQFDKRPYYSQIHDQKLGHGYFPTDVMNNHQYYSNNMYSNEMSSLIRQGVLQGVLPFDDGRNFFPYLTQPASGQANNRIQQDMKYLKAPAHRENPVQDALYYLYNNNYGMGEQYPTQVKQIGTELFNDPGLRDWKVSRNIK